jgi:hypothetical protein
MCVLFLKTRNLLPYKPILKYNKTQQFMVVIKKEFLKTRVFLYRKCFKITYFRCTEKGCQTFYSICKKKKLIPCYKYTNMKCDSGLNFCGDIKCISGLVMNISNKGNTRR